MPQRKKPFSGKKKKEQLTQKRQMKGMQRLPRAGRSTDDDNSDSSGSQEELVARKLMEQPMKNVAAGGGRNRNVNRYNLQFYQETKRELDEMNLEGYKALVQIEPKQREIDEKYFDKYDFPVRPPWKYDMDKDTLERNEQRYFREYVDKLMKSRKERGDSEFSLFELNLETWRQLWRVLELSDILLIIVDVRYATLMFPPYLYDYILRTIKKHAILVLNKVDLVAPEVVVAWKMYFQQKYPDLPVTLFASYPAKMKGTANKLIGHKRSMDGVYSIYKECLKCSDKQIDLSKWEKKILEDMHDENCLLGEEETVITGKPHADSSTQSHPRDQLPEAAYPQDVLTIGCIGFPNVGKSSLINALKGRKVVSVSRTPGHTKHFQTIFLTDKVRLCDCPGLVFPSSTPKYLQVLFGSFPIAQLKVPYRSLKFLAEHINLPRILKLQLPADYDEWSAVAIAEAWAIKRGYFTAKAQRPDRYRAANQLLRMCLIGQQNIVLQFYPPNFHEELEIWQQHAMLQDVKKYQNAEKDATSQDELLSETSEGEDSDAENNRSGSDDEGDLDDEPSKAAPRKSSNLFALLDNE